MNRPTRAGMSLAAVVAMLAAVLVPLLAPTPVGATSGASGTITFADGTTSATGVQPGDEFAIDLTIVGCTNSSAGSFTFNSYSETYAQFPLGPTWMNGTTYGPTWPKVTDETGLTDGVYRVHFTMPNLGDGPHTLMLGALQGVDCFLSGGVTNSVDIYQGTPPPTTTTTSTTVPPTTTSTTVPPTTTSTTVPSTTTTSTTVPSTTTTTPPTTVAPRTPGCPVRRPYRVYDNDLSRSIGAHLVARCGYRTEWRRVARTMGAYAVPSEWPRSKQIPARWRF